MPLQILQREKLDTSGLNAGVTNLREAIQFKKELAYKSNLLDYQIKQLSVQARQATTDEAKLQLETEKASMEKLKSLVDIASRIEDPDMRKKFLATYGAQGAADGTFKDALSNPAIQDIMAQVKPKGEERLQSAAATILENRLKPAQGGMEQQGEDGMASLGPTSLNRAGAVGGNTPTQGGYELSPEITLPGGMKLIDRATQLQQVGEDVRAKKQAERAEELIPLQKAVQGYTEVFDQAVTEMGGMESTGAGAIVKGSGAKVWSRLGDMPATAALQDITKSLVLQLASFANRGRPTDKDAEAMAGTLMKLTATQGSNAILKKYLNTILSSGDSMEADRLYGTLYKQRKSDTPAFATQRFSIKEKE